MGTSTDRTSGSGGAWKPLKHAATAYTRDLSRGSVPRSRAAVVLARHVPVLGGAATASASAAAGRTTAQRLGGLLAGVASGGLGEALRQASLGDLIGRDRFEVVDELVTQLAGDGGDLDGQAARDAVCDVLDELFRDADSWDDLENEATTRNDVVRLLELFLTHYIYNRVPVVAERLSTIADPEAARRADRQMRQVIEDCVAIRLPEKALSMDWSGPDGRAVVEDALGLAYQALEGLA
ncbi:Qat anti-phage system associated protein QatB [Streptomyces erythrochromogenes]|uniref:Qat anti-phage system associated protein QatB n=1 Tax=Streptomyces erythrochromogenes TaxID=285574 RepID=UPI0038270497